jgi:hypothetical protein
LGITRNELDFSTGEYWVQVHDLPLVLMTTLNIGACENLLSL